jgi:transcriptional regulator with XRE-family HTH domain
MVKSKTEEILDDVVKQLTLLRKEQGLSHEKLATLAGVTRPAISYIENDKNKPTLLLCLRMAEALNIPLSSIIKKAEEKIYNNKL